MSKRTLLATLILFLLGSIAGGHAAQAKSTDISWSPQTVELQLFPGTAAMMTATFISEKNLTDASLWIVPELQGFITVEPQFFDSVSAGTPYSIALIASVPSDTAFDTYEGTLHIRVGKRTIPQTLKIILKVEEPSTEAIPETVALPSSERITQDPESGAEFVTDEIVIGFNPQTTHDTVVSVVSTVGGVFLGSVPQLDLYQIQVTVTGLNELNQMIDQLQAMEAVSFATHHWLYQLQKVPTDPKFDRVWDEDNPAGNNWGHELIRLPSAWDYTTGNQSVKIAVVDSGFDPGHEDFGDNIFVAEGPPGTLSPMSKLADHGTMVAGIIGAQGENDKGIAGTVWDCSLMLYGAGYVGEDGKIRLTPLLAGGSMIDAIKDGAKVINYSAGTKPFISEEQADEASAHIKAVIRWARRHGKEVLFVIAAGNEGADVRFVAPANLAEDYEDNVITVAAADSNGNLSQGNWWTSNSGAGVTVAAPGGDGEKPPSEWGIYTNFPRKLWQPWKAYDWGEGTSLAAPFVTGLAGLIWSVNPTLTAAQVKQVIIDGAKNGDRQVPGHSFYIINAHESLNLLSYGSISGHVYQSDGTTPIEGAMVGVFDLGSPLNYGWVSTTADGHYVFSGLSTGEYAVRVEADGHAVEWYDGVIDKREATPVWVTAPNDTLGIDFTLELGGSIVGHVYESDGTTPIGGTQIDVFDYASLTDRAISYETTWSRPDGSYKTGGLPTGVYAVRVKADGYVAEWYDNAYDVLNAAPVSVTVPNDTHSIDFVLEPAAIVRAWTSDSIRGPEVTNFQIGTETVCVNYEYENPIGSVHKTTWYDDERTFLRTATHVTEYESGVGTWSLTHSEAFRIGGSYQADLFINDILLASVTWTVQPPVITRTWTSDTVRGPEITIFPARTEKVYVNYEYKNLIGSIQKIVWYDNEGSVMGLHTHVSENLSGIGTWGLTYPSERFWPGGSYSAELFINDILLTSVNWTVEYYANAHSAHFTHGYYVELMVDDPNETIQSVSVTGPGINGSMSLVKGVHPYYPNQWWSRPNVSLGISPPSLPLVYTFTIIDKFGATYIVTDTVLSYVKKFATHLSPSNNEIVTGDLVFSWTGIDLPEVRYKIELSDGQGNRIWDSPMITNTFYVYDGPALSSGNYQYYVTSWSKYGDESLAYATFRYAEEVIPPDLTVTSVSAPSSAKVGDTISVAFTVKNQGGSSSASFSNRVSLATSAYGTTYSLGNFIMSSLGAGASQTKTVSVTIPSVSPGYYYVTVFSDGFQAVAESDENNNIGSTYPNKIYISQASKFSIGDSVRTTANLNVRSGPGTSYPEITDPDYPDYAPAGSTGVVLSGPVSADGYVWWEIQYDAGYTGWSAENWLEKA